MHRLLLTSRRVNTTHFYNFLGASVGLFALGIYLTIMWKMSGDRWDTPEILELENRAKEMMEKQGAIDLTVTPQDRIEMALQEQLQE